MDEDAGKQVAVPTGESERAATMTQHEPSIWAQPSEASAAQDPSTDEDLQRSAGEDAASNGTPTPDAQIAASADDTTESAPDAVEPPFQAIWVLQRLRDLADRAPLQSDEPGGEGVRRRLTAAAAEVVSICLQETAGLKQARTLVDELVTEKWIVQETDSWKNLLDRLSLTDADALLEEKRANLAALSLLVNQREQKSKALENDIAAAEVRKAAIEDEVEARYQEKWQHAEQRIKAQTEEQKKRLEHSLATRKAEIEKQQGLLGELLATKDAELKDLQEQRAALNQEIADLRAGKLDLKPTTALTAMQQREMEQMRAATQELQGQKAALEKEVANLRFRLNTSSAPSSSTSPAKSDGWQRLFEALKLTQSGLLYQVKHAVEEAEAVAGEAGKPGDRVLKREAMDLVK
ncbi:MAG: hypothetical protein KDE45_17845, partial [Caldilineaceae bacterium]|nr:hypothetical protein [Caldilineaceae bacterium]